MNTLDTIGTNKEITNILTKENINAGDIELLQQKLNDLSSKLEPLAEDAVFGPKTAARTMEYLQSDPILAGALSERMTGLLDRYGQEKALDALQEQSFFNDQSYSAKFNDRVDGLTAHVPPERLAANATMPNLPAAFGPAANPAEVAPSFDPAFTV